MKNTSMWQYISIRLLGVWPYQYTFLHKNCIITVYLDPSDKIYKIDKYNSNIQNSQYSKSETIKRLQNYKSASKIVKYMSIYKSLPLQEDKNFTFQT